MQAQDRRVNVLLDRDQLAFVAREATRIGRPRTEVIRRALADLQRRMQPDEIHSNKGNGNGKEIGR